MKTVLERLRNGEKFDAVTRGLSEDKARQGESLGWKTRRSLPNVFEDAAYTLGCLWLIDRLEKNPTVKTSEG